MTLILLSDFYLHVKKGDKIIAYLKRKQIGAIGTIAGDYRVDEVVFHDHFWRI